MFVVSFIDQPGGEGDAEVSVALASTLPGCKYTVINYFNEICSHLDLGKNFFKEIYDIPNHINDIDEFNRELNKICGYYPEIQIEEVQYQTESSLKLRAEKVLNELMVKEIIE